MEWRPAWWSVCLPLLIFPCTIKSRISLLAPAHLGGPRKWAVKRLWCVWWCILAICYNWWFICNDSQLLNLVCSALSDLQNCVCVLILFDLIDCSVVVPVVNIEIFISETTPYPKKVPLHLLPLTWQMLTDFQNSFTGRCNKENFWQSVIECPTTPQRHCYTTLWNVCAQKLPCPRAEWSEYPCKTQPFKTVAEKCSSSDISIIFFTDKIIFTAPTPKNTQNDQLCAHPVTNEKDVAT